MEKRVMGVFMEYIKDLRFIDVDDLFVKKQHIKDKYENLNLDCKEMYKWYFYYQLCIIKNPLKKVLWAYINGEDVLDKLNEEYIKFCNKRDNLFKKKH